MMTTRLFVLACVLALTTASMDQQASLAAKSRLAAAKILATRSEQLAKGASSQCIFIPARTPWACRAVTLYFDLQ